ncbi:MAG: ROK family transcriptional regulator, partial [Pseudomonadota bacterium]
MPSDASDASVGRFAATNAQRSFNERLILSLMRRHGSLPKAELARLTGLSPTAVGSIIVQLEAAGLVRRGAPQRGRIGQPSVPYAIEPSGAFSLGLKVGRRSAELVLLDASLAIVALSETAYALPSIAEIESFVSTHARRMVRKIDRSRLVGLGVAMPSEIWSWCDEMGVSEDALLTWKDVDFSTQLGPKLNVPVRVMNDATAACAAQLALTQHDGETVEKRKPLSFIYFFVGWFIGGGVVLDGRVLEGRRGNAGALGSMPVCRRGGAGSPLPEQLIRIASVYCLERELLAHGIDPDCLQREDLDWSDLG